MHVVLFFGGIIFVLIMDNLIIQMKNTGVDAITLYFTANKHKKCRQDIFIELSK